MSEEKKLYQKAITAHFDASTYEVVHGKRLYYIISRDFDTKEEAEAWFEALTKLTEGSFFMTEWRVDRG